MYKDEHHQEKDTSLVFKQVKVTNLFSLNYKYGPIGRLDVNAAIRLHVYEDREYSQPGLLTDLEVDCLGSAVTVPKSASRPSALSRTGTDRWKTLGHHIRYIISCGDLL